MHRIQRVPLVLAIASVLVSGAIQPFAAAAADARDEDYQFLFVQSTSAGSYDGKRLTLQNVGPTIAFTDRPQRVTGHMKTAHFVSRWGEGADSFRADPPNAAFSMYTEDSLETAVVEISDPKLSGTTLSYGVRILDGKLPARFGESTLFIDILGRGRMFLVGAAVGSESAEAKQGQAQPQAAATTNTTATHTTTTAPPAASAECTAAEQQLVAASTEDEINLASQKVKVLCGH